jgi:multidrug efflux pump subunit AcrB
VIRSVVTPLEEQINGVENMQYIKSTASNDGTFSISVIFKQGVNPDQAAVNVQNRVQQATPILPQEVIRMGLTTSKQQNSMILIFNLFTEDNSKYDETFLQNYANINLIPQIKRVPGVGQAMVLGKRLFDAYLVESSKNGKLWSYTSRNYCRYCRPKFGGISRPIRRRI